METSYKHLMEKQDVEFFQLALMSLLRKTGGVIAFTQAEINDAGRFMGEINEVNGKYIIKVVPKPPNFDEKKANDYFEEARRNSQAMSQVSRNEPNP